MRFRKSARRQREDGAPSGSSQHLIVPFGAEYIDGRIKYNSSRRGTQFQPDRRLSAPAALSLHTYWTASEKVFLILD